MTLIAAKGSPPVTSRPLRRQLRMWEAVGISLAVMAPSMAVNINPLGVLSLAISPVRKATRILLSIEGATVALIVLVTVVIAVRLATGGDSQGHTADWSVFTVAPGTDVSGVFIGAVFGFLSFAGLEAAATLGEETRQPHRDIPRAILATAIFGGLYFVVVTAVEMMAFGTDAKDVAAFTGSGSLLGDLGGYYVASWVGDLIIFGAAINAFGCALASVTVPRPWSRGLGFGASGPGPGEAEIERSTPWRKG